MEKKYYFKIQASKKGSKEIFKSFAKDWNIAQKEIEIGKKRLRDVHSELYSVLVHLLIRNTISPQNIQYETTGKGFYNIENPLTLKAEPYQIVNYLSNGCSLCLQTVRNRLTRLAECGLIGKRKWSRDDITYEIDLYPKYLSIIDPETGKIIKTNDFGNTSISSSYKSKNKNLPDILSKNSKIKNKIIPLSDVNKRDSHSRISSSLKLEHLQNESKKVQLQESAQENESNNTLQTEKSEPKVARGQRHTNMDTSISVISAKLNHQTDDNEQLSVTERSRKLLNSQKKDAANKFFEIFISFFWAQWINLYLPKLAPRETIHYVQQAIETLMNDKTYFGACTTKEQIDYQTIKLNKAMKSTKQWHDSKKKQDENFSFRYLYPNTFLKNDIGERMSFKKSVLRAEMQMAKNNEMQMQMEKAMQRDRDKAMGEKHNHIIDNIIAWVHKNPENIKTKITDASNYLMEMNPELVMKLNTDWANTGRVKQAIENCKTFDLKLINDCFMAQEIIKTEIDSLLPKLQKTLQKTTQISQKILLKFRVKGAIKQPIPKAYDKETLTVLKYFTR